MKRLTPLVLFVACSSKPDVYDSRFPMTAVRRQLEEKSVRCSDVNTAKLSHIQTNLDAWLKNDPNKFYAALRNVDFRAEGKIVDDYQRTLSKFELGNQPEQNFMLLFADVGMAISKCGKGAFAFFKIIQNVTDRRELVSVELKRAVVDVVDRELHSPGTESIELISELLNLKILQLLVRSHYLVAAHSFEVQAEQINSRLKQQIEQNHQRVVAVEKAGNDEATAKRIVEETFKHIKEEIVTNRKNKADVLALWSLVHFEPVPVDNSVVVTEKADEVLGPDLMPANLVGTEMQPVIVDHTKEAFEFTVIEKTSPWSAFGVQVHDVIYLEQVNTNLHSADKISVLRAGRELELKKRKSSQPRS